jgi:uncharacterized membrane protein YeiH
MELSFINILDYLGTFAFAISGIRVAASKRLDWFGAYFVGLVTAIGGGTTRDLFLKTTPFWITQPSYLVVTALALIFVIGFGRWIVKLEYTIFIFDAIGLGLFTVVGIDKALAMEFPMWVAISMGLITGSVGGLIRDLLVNHTPLILRKDIYAMATIAGGLIYAMCVKLGMNPFITPILSFITVFFIRILAVRYKIALPVLKIKELENNKKNDSN